jgi:hypothetical protein
VWVGREMFRRMSEDPLLVMIVLINTKEEILEGLDMCA